MITLEKGNKILVLKDGKKQWVEVDFVGDSGIAYDKELNNYWEHEIFEVSIKTFKGDN